MSRLERLFDDAVQRLKAHKKAGDPYGMGPLASDHALLEKSWTYFKSRISMIENHYRDLLTARDKKNQVLLKSFEELRAHAIEMAKKNDQLDELEEKITRDRINDHLKFKRYKESIERSWQEERISLEDKLTALGFEIKERAEQAGQQQERSRLREASLLKEIEQLKAQATEWAKEKVSLQKEGVQKVQDLQDEVKQRDNKIDLMRAELERRDQLLKQLNQDKFHLSKRIEALEDQLLDLKEIITDKDKESDHLKTQIQILEKEKANLQHSWDKEKAEWRELWDRERELWDRERARRAS